MICLMTIDLRMMFRNVLAMIAKPTALVDGEKDKTMQVAIFEFEVMLEFIEIKIRYNFRAAGCGTESVVDLIITTALVDGEKDKTMQVAIFEFEVMVDFVEYKICVAVMS